MSGHVVVIGGGVTGLSTAWWLRREGVAVTLVERGIVGWEASGRNGGGATHAYSPLFREEQRLWPMMDELLGYPTEYQPQRIRIALDPAQLEQYWRVTNLAVQQGFRAEALDAHALKELVPWVPDSVAGGLLWHFGGHANPQRTVQAYAWAIEDLGGTILQHTAVTGFDLRGDKVVAVQTDQGPLGCDAVVIAAGPHTAQLAAMVGVTVPIAPARAEMIVTEPLPLIRHGGADGNGLYGRQTLRGNLAYGGGPHEWLELPDARTPKAVNSPVVRSLARRLHELFPKVAHARVIRSWAGVVENTPDGRPILDRLDAPANLVIATMSSVGFGLSPASGRAIMQLVTQGRCDFADLSQLTLSRFAGLPTDWQARNGWVPWSPDGAEGERGPARADAAGPLSASGQAQAHS
ncbi:NAD(P)/FAD-dependent oxidoreductase [Limobrevibacterium gyesilva]|uniref:FAD-binding oxidoreductase n=1 Tax=Limobrevibacterium gyesilva TaxID=2991712 RepID=A0AA41YLA9_9PROT|nr:FAD-binding oxidoreductase [Limobrevibacterium gyesilva]MCW3475524.1 FAD-binding oxidoreductase [Limobrevibacterium gyesilva]